MCKSAGEKCRPCWGCRQETHPSPATSVPGTGRRLSLMSWQGGTGNRKVSRRRWQKETSLWALCICKRKNSGGNPINQKHLPDNKRVQRFAVGSLAMPVLPFGVASAVFHVLSAAAEPIQATDLPLASPEARITVDPLYRSALDHSLHRLTCYFSTCITQISYFSTHIPPDYFTIAYISILLS